MLEYSPKHPGLLYGYTSALAVAGDDREELQSLWQIVDLAAL